MTTSKEGAGNYPGPLFITIQGVLKYFVDSP